MISITASEAQTLSGLSSQISDQLLRVLAFLNLQPARGVMVKLRIGEIIIIVEAQALLCTNRPWQSNHGLKAIKIVADTLWKADIQTMDLEHIDLTPAHDSAGGSDSLSRLISSCSINYVAASTLAHRYRVLTNPLKAILTDAFGIIVDRRTTTNYLITKSTQPSLNASQILVKLKQTQKTGSNSPKRGATAITSLPERTTPTPTHPSDA